MPLYRLQIRCPQVFYMVSHNGRPNSIPSHAKASRGEALSYVVADPRNRT